MDGFGRSGSSRSDGYGCDPEGKLVFWIPLVQDACGGVEELILEVWRLLDECSPGGSFDLFADGARWEWDGDHIIARVYDCERRSAEVAAVIGKACALAEAMPEVRRPRFTPPPVPVEVPAPNVAVAVIRSVARDAGYMQDPEEERDDG